MKFGEDTLRHQSHCSLINDTRNRTPVTQSRQKKREKKKGYAAATTKAPAAKNKIRWLRIFSHKNNYMH